MEYTRIELGSKRVSGAATTVLVTGRAYLGRIFLNASSGAIEIYDNTTVPAAGSASAIAVIASGTIVLSHMFDGVLANGLTIRSTAANSDYTAFFANN